ncbi:MAG: hypothetical protein JWP13_668, partial [Candidatus Saccharibacteria bacterium]|nr:hypothetical protein [Candidatus Saccharibacteria bacterium]
MNQTQNAVTDEKAKLLPRITGFFFDRPLRTFLIWLVLVVFGALSYTTLLKREGFPSIAIPIVIVNGVYGVNDPAQVDAKAAAPVSEQALKQAGVHSVTTTSEGSFFTAVIQYDEATDPAVAKSSLQRAVEGDKRIPDDVQFNFAAPHFGVTGGSTKKVDATVSVYSDKDMSLQELTNLARKAVEHLNKQPQTYVDNYFVEDPFQEAVNPATGRKVTVQRTFDRYVERADNAAKTYQSVVIGVAGARDADVIKLDNEIKTQLASLRGQSEFSDIHTQITASYAPAIK